MAKRIADLNASIGAPADAPVAAADRARIRTEVAEEFFRAEHGRDPVDAREVAGQIAKDSRPRSQTVAGYDLTFSPVKSVSTLWAVADPRMAAAIERAHRAAVADALRFIEEQALFTRTGPQGIRQVNVHGLVAAAFTHRDSRAGDPDLHTHVAVANKVQTLDGRWLSIDGRVLFKAKVAASETYNTALERHLRDSARRAVRRTARDRSGQAAHPRDRRRRPAAERALVQPPCLHQRPPGRTRRPVPGRSRPATHRGRSPPPGPAGHVGDPRRETRTALRTPNNVRPGWMKPLLSSAAVTPSRQWSPPRSHPPQTSRAWRMPSGSPRLLTGSWRCWNRAGRPGSCGTSAPKPNARSAPSTCPSTSPTAWSTSSSRKSWITDRSPSKRRPTGSRSRMSLRRADGSSVYTIAGADRYTSQRILDAEQRILTAAGRHDGAAVDASAVELALLEMAANGTALDAGQAALVRQMCTSGARVAVGDRAGRRREDHRDASPHPGLDPRRRPGHRPRPVRRRGRRPRRTHRHPSRHPGQTHLVPPAQ